MSRDYRLDYECEPEFVERHKHAEATLLGSLGYDEYADEDDNDDYTEMHKIKRNRVNLQNSFWND